MAQIAIVERKCTGCGLCQSNCPFGAIADKSQIMQVITAMKRSEEVIACVAPAFVGQFGKDATPAKIKAAMRILGFTDVVEVAIGADLCKKFRENDLVVNAVAAHQERFYGLSLDPDTQIIISTGATEAIAATLLALTGPGDEVLTFEPFYDSYGAIIGLSGATHTTAPLRAPDFQPDLATLENSFSERTRVVLVNNPHNPTGAVFPAETLQRIVELAAKYNAVIVTDEVYEHLTFGPAHIPVATLPGAAERTLTISSAGKTFSFTGWKIGWLSGPAELVAAVRAVKSFLSYSSGTPFQGAIALGLGMEDAFFTGIAQTLQAKRDVLSEGLRAAGLTVFEPQGTYFVNADVAPLGITDATALARRLPELVGVGAIPVAVFCHEEGAQRTRTLLRFAFCKKTEVLQEAAERIAKLGQVL